jgi:hypothetical protein
VRELSPVGGPPLGGTRVTVHGGGFDLNQLRLCARHRQPPRPAAVAARASALHPPSSTTHHTPHTTQHPPHSTHHTPHTTHHQPRHPPYSYPTIGGAPCDEPTLLHLDVLTCLTPPLATVTTTPTSTAAGSPLPLTLRLTLSESSASKHQPRALMESGGAAAAGDGGAAHHYARIEGGSAPAFTCTLIAETRTLERAALTSSNSIYSHATSPHLISHLIFRRRLISSHLIPSHLILSHWVHLSHPI